MLHKHENIDAQTTQALHSRFLGILSEMIIAWLLKKTTIILVPGVSKVRRWLGFTWASAHG